MAFISTPTTLEFVILAVILLYWIFIIGTAISILKRVDLSLTNRLLWIAILLIAPIIGLILYHFFGNPAVKTPSRS